MNTADLPLERTICLYPAYINRKRTLDQGRRIGKSQCVDNPTTTEIIDVLKATTSFSCYLEKKMYPREKNKEPSSFGRVRILVKNSDGTPIDAKLTTKKTIMIHTAEMISKLKTRGTKPQSQAAKNKKKKK